MIETDCFFEDNLDVIAKHYMPKPGEPRNTSSVGQLLYEFFVFYLYEHDHTTQAIAIKEPGGFARKYAGDKMPFSIIDPFDNHKNPGRTVKLNSA